MMVPFPECMLALRASGGPVLKLNGSGVGTFDGIENRSSEKYTLNPQDIGRFESLSHMKTI